MVDPRIASSQSGGCSCLGSLVGLAAVVSIGLLAGWFLVLAAVLVALVYGLVLLIDTFLIDKEDRSL